jgi:hypothetical protein
MSTFIVRTPDGEVTTKSSTTAKKIYRLSGRRLGEPNYIKTDGNIDWADFTRRCVDRCERLGKKLYVKESLQEHLPEGFVNEMRMTQHF